ncbi:MdlB ABC-type multidrug transport system, ATPase and permease components [Oxalobacteraceae bacterium]
MIVKNDTDLRKLIFRLWGHLSPRRRRHLIALAFLMPLGGLAEVMSLGAVLPFLGVLISPDKVFNNQWIMLATPYFGITSAQQLVVPMLLVFVLLAVFSALMRSAVLWLSTRLAFSCGSELSIEVYRRTLYQPYSVHIGRHSSKVISGIITKVGGCVNVLQQLATLFNMALIVILVVITMALIDLRVAVLTSLGFGISYVIVTLVCKSYLQSRGQRISRELENLHRSLQEGLGSIRDVLIDGTQSVYCETYSRADQPLRRAQSEVALITGIPRFAMESIGILLISVLAYWMSSQDGGINSALPVLGGMALCAQRLLPSLQQCYQAYATIVATQQSLHDAIELLDQPIPDYLNKRACEDLSRFDSIKLESVGFRYGPGLPWVLKEMCLTVRKGERIGFVGTTGSGKSTTLDLLMGLLQPTIGNLHIDGRVVDDLMRQAWQRNIAHVPQNIYLMDASIAENIAFGVDKSQIDMARVLKAAEQAQISEFIDSLPERYHTFAGERGVRFSGGQRQRIGIARALYKQATLLVLDEATSALDEVTEKSVMNAIDALDRDLTVLIIAHRMSSVRRCDKVYRVNNGRIESDSTIHVQV